VDHRGLAVGAGGRDDCLRLPAVEARRQQCQPAVRVFIGHDGDPVALLLRERKRSHLVGQNCGRAARYGGGSKAAPVLPRAGQGGEQKAGLHGPRIGSKAKDLGVARSSKPRHTG
jgi:hypothetical protein